MKHLPIDNKLFIENRKRFTKELKRSSIAIFIVMMKYPTMAIRFTNSSKTVICIGLQELSRKIAC